MNGDPISAWLCRVRINAHLLDLLQQKRPQLSEIAFQIV
ncbi:hypothetical protein SAMN06273570_1162 [Candidatus Pantoea floridensis]|uniref:Uncharacterized protein n=1 Tax=Candidatus Pantoea floridensis TaxID=1938870 RepID=A0A286BRU9_9GAMM|nr:hypothetical protein BX596_2839 [Enterobacteriaceae bacterium JKS000233]SOD36848.1 hypothetical protein SAMN06273570_1162 [Pantoea floridensis]